MKIKQVPEDFIVEEIARPNLNGGKFAYFLMRKKQWNTMDAVFEIARKLGINEKRIAYGGIKDRQAVTQQYISIEGVSNIGNLGIKDIELEYLGQGSERMNTDFVFGNRFKITLRDLSKKLQCIPKFFPNYFDDQRFGVNANNHLVGRALVKKEFGRACTLLGLEPEKNQYINALIAKKEVLKLCFNAYQSYLFNEALAEHVRKHYDFKEVPYAAGKLAFANVNAVKNFEMPLISFDAELSGEVKLIYEAVLKKEGIRQSDFLIRQIPFLVQQSAYRMAFVAVTDFKIESFEADELNSGKFKQIVSFSLPKGSYATIAIKALHAFSEV